MTHFTPAAPGTELRRQQDKEMILDPDRWPLWPRLPLTRDNWLHERRDHGFVFNGSTRDNTVEPRVYLLTIFQQVDGDTETIDYSDIDALLDDGWTVD